MFSRLKTLPFTIVLTILIWMYAEAEFTATQEGVAVRVRFQSTDPGDYSVRIFDDRGNPIRTLDVTLSVQGAKGQLDRLRDQSRSGGGGGGEPLPTLVLQREPASIPPAGATVALAPLLNELPFFRDRGITVISSFPERVRIDGDHLNRIPLTLTPNALRNNGVPVIVSSFEPSAVELTIPDKLLKEIHDASAITLSAEPQQLLTGAVGAVRPVRVRIQAEYKGESLANRDERVVVTPQEVICNLKVETVLSQRYALPAPTHILITGPASVLSPYRIEISPDKVQLRVTGTPEAVEKLRKSLDAGDSAPPESVIRAYVDLTAEDKPSEKPIIKRVRYALPEGISLESKIDTVEVRLTTPPPSPTHP
jgi:hypothetical protein